tara:strand:- start:255 stop:395 length:141 start_codon:yes stop_codon:yes gene_type:complete
MCRCCNREVKDAKEVEAYMKEAVFQIAVLGLVFFIFYNVANAFMKL